MAGLHPVIMQPLAQNTNRNTPEGQPSLVTLCLRLFTE
jgi:hypothetical protein